MRESLKDYFYFSKGEKNGLVILIGILVVTIIFPIVFPISTGSKNQHHLDFEKEIKYFSLSLEEIDEPEYKNKLDQYIIERYDSLELFFFNPNTTSKENYIKLGLTDKQIKTIFNYTDKGGKFYVKDDFRKIYGIRNQQYQILKPYILLPENQITDLTKFDKSGNQNSKQNITGVSFVFNPNTATDEEFQKLGLTDMNIKTIRNYQAKIGTFKSKEDFKKIYGISEDKYNQIEPYIFIPQEVEKPIERIRIEINTAGIQELNQIKGIGNYSAQAIIRYRQSLGGFVNIEQLLEIKSITPEIFELIKPSLYTDKSKITTISLNFAEVEDLTSHPYLNYYQAKEIVKFRSNNGPFQDKKQLVLNKILMEQTYSKIEPYLTLN